MRLLRNHWLVGTLLATLLLALIPYLTLARPTIAPAPPATAIPAPVIAAPVIPATVAPVTRRLASSTITRPKSLHAAMAEPPYIPILMYHYVREVDEASDPLGFRLSVRPDRFEEQLAWLRANGYESLLMREVAACLRGEQHCPERAVAITFDDGYLDQTSAALPALRRYGYRATFYVVGAFIGTEGYMDWVHLRQLRDSGMEIGAHTMSHADLARLDLPAARAEIVGSRSVLEQRLGVKIVSFSYPAGSYTPAIADLVRAAGFHSAVTTGQGADLRPLYELPRRRVLGGETILGFPWYVVPLKPE